MKQTAVEWLLEQYTQGNYSWEVYEQAKQMEKEQIKDAYLYSSKETCYYYGEEPPFDDTKAAELYYQQTYEQ